MKLSARPRAFLMAVLAAYFWWAFEFAKHDPSLRNIIPFGEDPYDAVSSFGAITAVLLALVSLVRSCFPKRVEPSRQTIYILRAQAAIPLCILVTVAAEIVAMMRHVSMWVGMQGSTRLLALQTSLAVLAAVMLFLTRGDTFGPWPQFVRAGAIWLATLFALSVYPEQLILATPGHLLTVVLGDVFLFAPVGAFVEAWLPDPSSAAKAIVAERNGARRFIAFAAVVATGFVIGASAYFAEVSESSTRPAIHQMLFVGSVFVSLGASGMAIGYAFLGRLLGFVVPYRFIAAD